jgi:Ni/Fe-hydrogenase subunit HybB-like protein
MTAQARPLEGKLLTPFIKFMLLLWGLGTIAGLVRFTMGLGAATAMNDGYPWGLWIAFDVVVGTGLASGGYALALVVFILNRGRYHPLVRPALLTSGLGYAVAGVAVSFDLGRYWSMWRIPTMPWRWNGNSVLLEVAICMMAYTLVIFLELSPAWLEGLSASRHPGRASAARRWLPRAERALPVIVALGLVLPTMHQSGLGSLMLLAGAKLHPLWNTGLLPLLFLISAFGMGYAVIFFESIFSSTAFQRPLETRMLASLGRFVAGVIVAFLVVRLGGLLVAGNFGFALAFDRFAAFFWGENLALLAGAVLFLRQGTHVRADQQLQAALLSIGGASLYRIDVFLIGFNPGANWHYFPSVGEILVTLGLIATETVIYVIVVRKFPILAGVTPAPRRDLPAGLKQGATP